MRIFVAGAGGYVGMVLCRQLLQSGHEVTAFDRYFFGQTPDGCRIVRGDIRTVQASAIEGHDAVVDLAGLSNDATCEIDEKTTFSINKDGALNLVSEAMAAGIYRYVYSSSASVYGDGKSLNLTEEAQLRPLTAYATSKMMVEIELLGIKNSWFEPVVLRNATVFGVSPRMRFDLAINVMTMRAWRDRIIYIMGGGEQWRPFVHVEDVGRAIIWALTAQKEIVSGQTFNVGSEDNQYTIRQLSGLISSCLQGVTIHHIPDSTDDRSYHLSFNKFHKASGIRKLQSVWNGVQDIIAALQRGVIDPSDPRTVTLNWYKSMLEWKDRLNDLTKGGPIL